MPASPVTLRPVTLLVATSNPGKLRDFATAASIHAGPGLHIDPLPGLADIPPPPEDEPTFEGNARAKAVFYSLHAVGAFVLADDSGLEVDGLDGEPGVRSARYADDHGYALHSGQTHDSRNNLLLLDRLADRSAFRQARYRCVLALARDGEVLATAQGAVEGEILLAARGTGGFGYDPLFLVPQLDRTMAELDPVTRLGLSHRGRALANLLQHFQY